MDITPRRRASSFSRSIGLLVHSTYMYILKYLVSKIGADAAENEKEYNKRAKIWHRLAKRFSKQHTQQHAQCKATVEAGGDLRGLVGRGAGQGLQQIPEEVRRDAEVREA